MFLSVRFDADIVSPNIAVSLDAEEKLATGRAVPVDQAIRAGLPLEQIRAVWLSY
jgi:hypothetical protein